MDFYLKCRLIIEADTKSFSIFIFQKFKKLIYVSWNDIAHPFSQTYI